MGSDQVDSRHPAASCRSFTVADVPDAFRPSLLPLLLTIAVVAGGCAVALPGGTPQPTASKLKRPLPQTNETGTLGADGRYRLSADEEALNCHKLTGRMQVRLMQVRAPAASTTEGARTLHGTATAVFGGTTRGLDPEAERRRDLALLKAYNRRLAEKGCPTFDLARELRAQPGGEMPRPVTPAKSR